MKCWQCGTELTWNADFDIEPDEPRGELFYMWADLSCSNCGCSVEVYVPRPDVNPDET